MAAAAREFGVFVKPIGSACNLNCRYCYYLKTGALYAGDVAPRMPDDLLERYIQQHLEACPTPTVFFAWHGGEPTLLGVDFFRRVVALQRRHCPPGRRVLNGIQTNGTLLDEEWCRFFQREGFTVGLSLDGPQPLHDAFRRSQGGQPTHERVLRAWRLLQGYGVPCDILCVVHALNVGQPLAVYRFFREIGADYIQFLPLVAPDGRGGVTPESTPAEAYGEFLCAVFAEWLAHDARRIGVQAFEEAARPLLGLEHALCHFRPTCGEVGVLEHNGDYYLCDHYVTPAHRLGNLRERSLASLVDDPAQQAFGRAKWEALPAYCRQCEALAMCHGGCPKDRLLRAPDGEEGLNYLCAGFKRFFAFCRPYLQRLAERRQPGQAVGRLLDLMPPADAPRPPRPGRNDPCPCGSGIKYKQCCLGRPLDPWLLGF